MSAQLTSDNTLSMTRHSSPQHARHMDANQGAFDCNSLLASLMQEALQLAAWDTPFCCLVQTGETS